MKQTKTSVFTHPCPKSEPNLMKRVQTWVWWMPDPENPSNSVHQSLPFSPCLFLSLTHSVQNFFVCWMVFTVNFIIIIIVTGSCSTKHTHVFPLFPRKARVDRSLRTSGPETGLINWLDFGSGPHWLLCSVRRVGQHDERSHGDDDERLSQGLQVQGRDWTGWAWRILQKGGWWVWVCVLG